MVTFAPARRSTVAAVNPRAPQPMTATSRAPPARALRVATSADPQDSDQPLPPWP
ncbi:hypothetical protein [Caulobacter sp. UC70_42]|uniref:hypothetical protein n=1 Tax=Caulobacter sp. UC70_42 TaxID=3374551 RepID=UPI00375706F9